jgi:hypothetical protein
VGSGNRAGSSDRSQPLTRWQDWVAAAGITLVAAALVIADVADAGLRRWWDGHSFTTDTVAGLLVLLITLQVVDQVLRIRQIRDRSRAVAAQTAILLSQATRTTQAVSAALGGSGDRDAANDELRSYLTMLLVGAPVLIEERVSRNFLEEAQRLAGWMAHLLATTAGGAGGADRGTNLDDRLQRLRSASRPLLRVLSQQELTAVTGDQ